MERQCVICGALFKCSPSDNKVTCSPACRSKRAALSASRTKRGTKWTEEQRQRLSGSAERKAQLEGIRESAVAAALSKPEGQRGIHNRNSQLWILTDPTGRKHAVINLRDWARTHYRDFSPDAADPERAADNIRTGISAIASSMRDAESRKGRPVSTYKGWQLDRLPKLIDNRCAGEETIKILDMWLNGASANSIYKAFGIGHQKIMKTLISVGLLNTDEARLFRAGLTVEEIADRLNVSVRRVEGRIPYSKGSYMRENPTKNALAIRQTRKKEHNND